MKPIITAARIRYIIADTRTEKDIADSLRAHRIRYRYSTEGGILHIRVPLRSGCLMISRSVTRSAPPVVRFAPPSRPCSVPLLPDPELFRSVSVPRSAPPALAPLRSSARVPAPLRSDI